MVLPIFTELDTLILILAGVRLIFSPFIFFCMCKVFVGKRKAHFLHMTLSGRSHFICGVFLLDNINDRRIHQFWHAFRGMIHSLAFSYNNILSVSICFFVYETACIYKRSHCYVFIFLFSLSFLNQATTYIVARRCCLQCDREAVTLMVRIQAERTTEVYRNSC